MEFLQEKKIRIIKKVIEESYEMKWNKLVLI